MTEKITVDNLKKGKFMTLENLPVLKGDDKVGSLGMPRKPMKEIIENLQKSMEGSTITEEEWLSYRRDM